MRNSEVPLFSVREYGIFPINPVVDANCRFIAANQDVA